MSVSTMSLTSHLNYPLFQLGVFRFRCDEDGNVGVGVFPEGEEILIFSGGKHEKPFAGS
jgi:hypothetical protein